jgi:signal transduction histidine kinase
VEIFIYILSTIIVINIFLVTFFTRKTKKKFELDKQKKIFETEAKISKKLHDELANDVFLCMAKTHHISQSNFQDTKKELLVYLNSIYDRVRDMSHELSISISGDLKDSIKDLLAKYSSSDIRILLKTNGFEGGPQFPELVVHTVYRSIQELINNSIKHSDATYIRIDMFNSENDLNVTYQDDGKGFDVNKQNLGGLSNLKGRIKALNGRFDFVSSHEHGSMFQIIIPKKYDKSIAC